MDEWNNPSSHTADTVREYTTYTNILRYTYVVENGSHYLGCISNRVYADCTLYYYPAGAGSSDEIEATNAISCDYQSDHYSNSAAFEAAVDNYLNNPIIDRIEELIIKVEAPDGPTRYAYEDIWYY